MRIGIIVKYTDLPHGYVDEIIRRLAESDWVDMVRLFSDSTPSSPSQDPLKGLFSIIADIERRIVPNPFNRPFNSISREPVRLAAKVVSEATLDDLRDNPGEFELDYLIDSRTSFQPDPDAFAALASGGLVRFVESVETAGLPFGLTSLLANNSTTKLMLKLISGGDGSEPKTVEAAEIATEFCWSRNRDKALAVFPDLLMRWYNRQCRGLPAVEPPEAAPDKGSAVSFGLPAKLGYAVRLTCSVFNRAVTRRVGNGFRRLSGKREPGFWTVRFGDLKLEPAEWSSVKTDPKARWTADPFLLSTEKNRFVLFEDWEVTRKLGRISAMDASGGEIFPVLDEPFHLSYPFTFYRHGQWWMLPETSQAEAVRLYRIEFDSNGTTFKAVFEREILQGRFTDPTVVRIDGTDFLFVNPYKAYSRNFNEVLDVYFADDITSAKAELQPHPLNPVVIDPLAARSAGRAVVRDDGCVNRYSQKCDLMYGEDLVENIVSVECDDFRLHSKRVLNRNTFSKRVHHFDSDGQFGATDLYFDH